MSPLSLPAQHGDSDSKECTARFFRMFASRESGGIQLMTEGDFRALYATRLCLNHPNVLHHIHAWIFAQGARLWRDSRGLHWSFFGEATEQKSSDADWPTLDLKIPLDKVSRHSLK